jgi:hypothetical protein
MARIIRNRVVKKDFTKLDALMQDYVTAENSAAIAARKMKEAMSAIRDEMSRNLVTEHVSGGAGIKAELFRSAGRATSTIDPQGFRKLCKDDKDFYACVKVGIMDARKVLPMRQLDTITSVTAAKPGEEQVKITVL